MTTINPSIAAQVEILHRDVAAHMPPEALTAFAAEQADLRKAGPPVGVLGPGTSMPDGVLLDVHGRPTTLAAVRDGKPAVVVFYRGGWCPYCNIALPVSPQKPDGSLSTQQAKELDFAVVSDPGNQLARRLGILTEPTPQVQAAQRSLGLNLTELNPDGTAQLPMPTTVVVDATGIVRWIDVQADYSTRSEVGAIMAAVSTTLD